jgi:alpha-1,3-rhamnosyl/mannosyltransferase
LLSRVPRPGLEARIHFPGYIAEADLPSLYAGAALFVYPSLLEGFGFPPLEAMATGVPVVASGTSSLRENLAGAATLVPSGDTSQLAAAMCKLLTDEAERSRGVEAGLKRSQSYRWDRFAAETLACYEELCREDETGA